MKPRIVITQGDPAGIGPEIISKALRDPHILALCEPIVIAPRVSRTLRLGRPSKEAGASALEALREAMGMMQRRQAQALVTAPVSKESLHLAGAKAPGHTEWLAQASESSPVAMLMVAGKLRALLLTRHVPLSQVSKKLTSQAIQEGAKLAYSFVKNVLGKKRPKLAACGLNPHAGDGGLLGNEEIRTLKPALSALAKRGILIYGPAGADSVFRDMAQGAYDLALAAYHDQGMIPLKLFAPERLVNITLGLPFIRTSPGHGTAYDIAGKGKADPRPLKEAIRLAVEYSRNPFSPAGREKARMRGANHMQTSPHPPPSPARGEGVVVHRPPLGQHFLRDQKVIRTILEAAELSPDETALEIGPGKGILTEPLIPLVNKLVAVEFDRTLAPKLQERFASYPHVKIIQEDFLKTNLYQLFPEASPPAPLPVGEGSKQFSFPPPPGEGGPSKTVGEATPIKVLGNLPYSITAPIFEKLLSWPGWETGVFLIQREVGERIRSGPGSKVFGVLSLAVQLFADAEAIATVKPGAFVPPPKVTSMVIRLRRKRSLPLPDPEIPAFFDLVHAAFSHRRKTLANSLAFFTQIPKAEIEPWLTERGLHANARAETLGLQDYVQLTTPWAIFRRERKLT